MIIKNKITLIILLISLVVLTFSVQIKAEGSDDVVPDIKFGKQTYFPGDEFTMSLRLSGDNLNTLTTKGVEVVLEYDHFNFELLNNSPEKDLMNSYIDFTNKFNSINKSDNKQNIRVAYFNITNPVTIKNGANIINVKFKVKKDAKPGIKRFVLKPFGLVDTQFKVYHVNNDEAFTRTLEILSSDLKRPSAGLKTFNDVDIKHWAKVYIDKLVERKVVMGVDSNNFKPQNNVTRAQFAAFIVRALELDLIDYKGEFKDVKAGEWYDKLVATAVKSKIIEGMGAGRFEPNSNITREQMCAMIMRAYEYINGLETKGYVSKYKNRFSDMKDISSWAQDYVKGANVLGIVNGMSDTKFIPKSNSLREQAAAIIYKFLKASNLD
ncbi:S-layer homology domain-containing protein [Pseudobacteroides cellulosolvens]|uniref:S-layer domain-containing protein n=2 Tax=Pseudobacteroides cellulosolvens TaxID=35825 RepID=A0A0L6JPD4_9FIRM|nr:S-layer homology domain-containing protein [Pseudobacteroides cellulosolvens]KNY27648.1 S-layer domain-containing protein [Pseudobacteroides cellulosolvens ATCC 35603 = DSM 2933]